MTSEGEHRESTFLRTFTFGHVRQLDSIAASMLTELADRTPLLAGADRVN